MRTTTATADRSTVRPRAVIATAFAILFVLVPAAQADSRGFDQVPWTEGFFYGDFEIALFAGATAAQFCTGEEPTHDARLFTRRDGTLEFKVDASRQPLYLYATPLGGPEFVEQTCAALLDGDPATVPLEPFAVGEGQVRLRFALAPTGEIHIVNSAIGSATSADGQTWRVRGWADLMVVDGAPVGSPTEFQGLRIARTGA